LGEDAREARLIRALLWEELGRQGLLADSNPYRDCLARVQDYGGKAMKRFSSVFDSTDWRAANAVLTYPYTEGQLVRILGFGRLLTEFSVSTLVARLNVVGLEEVLELGELSNLIVTVCDQYIDLQPEGTPVLSRRMLEGAKARSRLSFGWMKRRSGTAQQRVMARLVTLYFRRLAKLPYAVRHESLHAFMHRVIISMYDAEMDAERKSNGTPRERTLRRKSALPFVVMGLPVWLSAPDIEVTTFRRHLRWLYGLGEFIGWVDDVIDLDEDRNDGHSNRVHNALAGVRRPLRRRVLAQSIARRGRRVVETKPDFVGCESQPADCDALSAVIISWFGGVPPTR
jgi:hypothetical protein